MASLIKEGKYWKVYWYQHGKHHKRSTRTTNKTLALQILRKIEDELSANRFSVPVPSEKITVASFLDLALEYSKVNKGKRTAEREKSIFKAFKKFCGSLPINQITPILIENYKNHLLADHKPGGANVYLRHLSAAFSLAVTPYNFLLQNPFKKVKKLKVPKRLPNFMTEKQIKKLLNHTHGKKIHEHIMIALYTGARLSEVCNLEWKNVDLGNNIIIFFRKGSKESPVPIPNVLAKYLKTLGTKEYVISGSRDIELISKAFRKIADKLGLSEFSFHSLRHTYASWLVQRGVSLKEIKELLGHESIKTTEIYAHLSPENLRDAVSVLDR